MVSVRSPLFALLAAALLLAFTEGRVPGINSNDALGQPTSPESRTNIKILTTLIRSLFTRNNFELEAPGEPQEAKMDKPTQILLSSLEARKRSEPEPEESRRFLASFLKSKRATGANENTDEKGEHLNPIDFKNAAQITDNNGNRPAGAGDPIENIGVDWDFFEGDIKNAADRQGRSMIKEPQQKWPRGEIPYVIASGFTASERATIAKAVLEFERNTCIRVRPLGPTDDASQGYIRIIKGDGCYSSVGRQVNEPGQELSLGDGCLYSGIVVHEFMHAVGFWHEQSRPDRDDYVRIHYDNIQFGKDYNFKKYNTDEVQLKGTKYDIGSIMHYGPNAFAKDRSRPTISALQQTSVTMGQRERLSEQDISKINKLYDCQSVTAPPTPVKPEECTDRDMYCKDWAASEECTKNPLYMNIYCAKSCLTCTSEKCQDLNQHCAAWAETGECSTNPAYMTLYCKQSCGLCGGGSGPACNNLNDFCKAWADDGECKKNPDYMKGHCRKACGLC